MNKVQFERIGLWMERQGILITDSDERFWFDELEQNERRD